MTDVINYSTQIKKQKLAQLNTQLERMPKFMKRFFLSLEIKGYSAGTLLAYAYDINAFFDFLYISDPDISSVDRKKLKIGILSKITPSDIESFLHYIQMYSDGERIYSNNEKGKSRKLSAIRSMYKYFNKMGYIKTNPAIIVDMPKEKDFDNQITRLEPNEIALLLDYVESGAAFTDHQKKYHEKTKVRDVAIMTLLLGTGIRVSECVGLDMNHINFDNDSMVVTRKGGKVSLIYFGSEVREALLKYYDKRQQMVAAKEEDRKALFLSMQNTRMSVISIERMVKKYAAAITKMKKITPHKLRSTYGTELYRETKDINIVAEILGHKDVNTTRKYYTAISEEQKWQIKEAVRLRKDPENSHKDERGI